MKKKYKNRVKLLSDTDDYVYNFFGETTREHLEREERIFKKWVYMHEYDHSKKYKKMLAEMTLGEANEIIDLGVDRTYSDKEPLDMPHLVRAVEVLREHLGFYKKFYDDYKRKYYDNK